MLLSLVAVMVVALPQLGDIQFKKTVVDTRFVSEGVAVGDVDRDGKLDIIAGSVWYQAPEWKPNEISPIKLVDPKQAWSDSFHNWAADLNRDGWVDQIVIGMPGGKAVWRENPGAARHTSDERGGVPWKEHLIWRSAGNESPLYVDLFGDGRKELVMAYDDAYLAWFEPSSDPYKEWICHDVSALKGAGSQRYSHGLGVGDLNDDGRNEIITTGGYYIPGNDARRGPWTLVKVDLGPDCAQMLAHDANKDSGQDVLSTSAHARGVWWFEQSMTGGFTRHLIDETVSVTHAACLAVLGGSVNLITGKRKWGHPPGVDVGSEEPHWLVRYELQGGKWVRHVIDEDSGVGTQFVLQDVDSDGLLDIVTANKNGVFLFVQNSS